MITVDFTKYDRTLFAGPENAKRMADIVNDVVDGDDTILIIAHGKQLISSSFIHALLGERFRRFPSDKNTIAKMKYQGVSVNSQSEIARAIKRAHRERD